MADAKDLTLELILISGNAKASIALDIELSAELKNEGLMREALSQLQRLRKSSGLAINDRIKLILSCDNHELLSALKYHHDYLASELLASKLTLRKVPEAEIKHQPENIDINGIKLLVCLSLSFNQA